MPAPTIELRKFPTVRESDAWTLGCWGVTEEGEGEKGIEEDVAEVNSTFRGVAESGGELIEEKSMEWFAVRPWCCPSCRRTRRKLHELARTGNLGSRSIEVSLINSQTERPLTTT